MSSVVPSTGPEAVIEKKRAGPTWNTGPKSPAQANVPESISIEPTVRKPIVRLGATWAVASPAKSKTVAEVSSSYPSPDSSSPSHEQELEEDELISEVEEEPVEKPPVTESSPKTKTKKTTAAKPKVAKVQSAPKEKKIAKRGPRKKTPAGGDVPGSDDSGDATNGSGRKKGADKDKKVDKSKGKGKGKAVEKTEDEIDELDPEVKEDIEPATPHMDDRATGNFTVASGSGAAHLVPVAESVDQAERQGEIIPESETGSRERPHLVRSYKSRWHGDVAEDDEDDREPMFLSQPPSTGLLCEYYRDVSVERFTSLISPIFNRGSEESRADQPSEAASTTNDHSLAPGDDRNSGDDGKSLKEGRDVDGGRDRKRVKVAESRKVIVLHSQRESIPLVAARPKPQESDSSSFDSGKPEIESPTRYPSSSTSYREIHPSSHHHDHHRQASSPSPHQSVDASVANFAAQYPSLNYSSIHAPSIPSPWTGSSSDSSSYRRESDAVAMARIEAGNENTLATQNQSMREEKADAMEDESMEETAPVGKFTSLFTQHASRLPFAPPAPLVPESDVEPSDESMEESMGPLDNRFTPLFTQPAIAHQLGRDAAPQGVTLVGSTGHDQQDHVLETLLAGIDTANPVSSSSQAEVGEPGSSLGERREAPAQARVENGPTPTPESAPHPAEELSSWGSSMFPSFTDSNAITQHEPSEVDHADKSPLPADENASMQSSVISPIKINHTRSENGSAEIGSLPHSAQYPADDESSSLGSSMFPSSINDAFRLARDQGSFQQSQNVDVEDVRHYGSLPAQPDVDQVEEEDGIRNKDMDVDVDQDQVSMISKPPSLSEGSNAAVIPGLTSTTTHAYDIVQLSGQPARMEDTSGQGHRVEQAMGSSNVIQSQNEVEPISALGRPEDMSEERRLVDQPVPQAIPSSSSNAVQVGIQEKARNMEAEAPSIPSIPINRMTKILPGMDLDQLTVHQLRMLGIRYIDLGPPLPTNIIPTSTQGVVVNDNSSSDLRSEVPAVISNGESSKGAVKAVQKAKAAIKSKELAGREGEKTDMTASGGNVEGPVAKKKKGKNVAVAASAAVGPGSTKNTNIGGQNKKRDLAAAGLEEDGVDPEKKAVDVGAIATAGMEKVSLGRKRTRRRHAVPQVSEKAMNREKVTGDTQDGTAVLANGSNQPLHIAPTSNVTSTIIEKENGGKAGPAPANLTRSLPAAKKVVETGPAKPHSRLLQFGKPPGAPGTPLSTEAIPANIDIDVFGPNTPIAKMLGNGKEVDVATSGGSTSDDMVVDEVESTVDQAGAEQEEVQTTEQGPQIDDKTSRDLDMWNETLHPDITFHLEYVGLTYPITEFEIKYLPIVKVIKSRFTSWSRLAEAKPYKACVLGGSESENQAMKRFLSKGYETAEQFDMEYSEDLMRVLAGKLDLVGRYEPARQAYVRILSSPTLDIHGGTVTVSDELTKMLADCRESWSIDAMAGWFQRRKRIVVYSYNFSKRTLSIYTLGREIKAKKLAKWTESIQQFQTQLANRLKLSSDQITVKNYHLLENASEIEEGPLAISILQELFLSQDPVKMAGKSALAVLPAWVNKLRRHHVRLLLDDHAVAVELDAKLQTA